MVTSKLYVVITNVIMILLQLIFVYVRHIRPTSNSHAKKRVIDCVNWQCIHLFYVNFPYSSQIRFLCMDKYYLSFRFIDLRIKNGLNV